MLRKDLIALIDRILVKDGINKTELTWDSQCMELNYGRDLPDCSTGLLRVLLKRAQALDKFYSSLKVLGFTGTRSASQAHALIHDEHLIDGSKDAPSNVLNDLNHIMKTYGTSLVGVNNETGDWTEENDGYTVCSKDYLKRYYERHGFNVVGSIDQIRGKYVVASAQCFYQPSMNDVQNELQALASYVVDTANSDRINTKYYKQVSAKPAKARA